MAAILTTVSNCEEAQRQVKSKQFGRAEGSTKVLMYNKRRGTEALPVRLILL